MPTELDNQIEDILSIDPPLWTLFRQNPQPDWVKGVPKFNTADRIQNIDTSFKLLLKKLWLPVAERIIHYLDLGSEQEEWFSGDRIVNAAEMYLDWTNESAKKIIIAGVSGERPTWEQLCQAPTLAETAELSLLVGFHSGSELTELGTKRGEYDQVFGTFDSLNTDSISPFLRSLVSPDRDTSQKLDQDNSPNFFLFGINLLTFPLDFDPTMKTELLQVFILMSIGLTQLFSFTNNEVPLWQQAGLEAVCFEFEDDELPKVEPFLKLVNPRVLTAVGPMEAGLETLIEETAVVYLHGGDKNQDFIQPLRTTHFLPQLLLQPFSNPFPIFLAIHCPTVAPGTVGMCRVYRHKNGSVGIIFVFRRDDDQQRRRRRKTRNEILTLYHEVGSTERSPFSENSQKDLEELLRLVHKWIEAKEHFGGEIQVD